LTGAGILLTPGCISHCSFRRESYSTRFVKAQIVVDFSHFGLPQANLLAALRGGDLTAIAAALPQTWPDPTPFVLMLALLASVVMIIRYRRARLLQSAVAIALIASMVIGPLLNTFKIDSFITAEVAKAAAQDEQQSESDMQLSMRSLGDKVKFDPLADPLQSSAKSTQLVASDYQSTLSNVQSTSLQTAGPLLLTDTITDTDHDGLSDFTEERVGTDPAVADSDNDGLSDSVEINGFAHAGDGRRWHTNPLAVDSNDDGSPDGVEWGYDSSGNLLSSPRDTDGDGTPDIFDADNDNDGVPDSGDITGNIAGLATG
jgi:hypothetical protein